MRQTLSLLRSQLYPLFGKREGEAVIALIFLFVKGWHRVDMIMHEGDDLSDFTKSQIDNILRRLIKGEPIQYITGQARFYGLDFSVTPDVLIPRPETAELVDFIVKFAAGKEDLRVMDIATGSGCIAIALARTLPFARVTASDISPKALEVARRNAQNLKVKVNFIEADLLRMTLPPDNYDIIVSNPPYVCNEEKAGMERNVLDYEPAQALFVPDDDPLIFYKHITILATKALAPGGGLFLEINPRFSSEMRSLLEEKGFEQIEIIKDSYGHDRMATALKPDKI